jgi:hypothetical protein
MKKFIAVMVVLMGLMTTNSYAWKPDKWTTKDTVLQVAVFTTLFLDCNQTYYRHGYKETNPLLGKYPSNKEVNIYFISCALLHTGIAYALPNPYRNAWQLLTIGFESSVVYNNYRIGIKFEF